MANNTSPSILVGFLPQCDMGGEITFTPDQVTAYTLFLDQNGNLASAEAVVENCLIDGRTMSAQTLALKDPTGFRNLMKEAKPDIRPSTRQQGVVSWARRPREMIPQG